MWVNSDRNLGLSVCGLIQSVGFSVTDHSVSPIEFNRPIEFSRAVGFKNEDSRCPGKVCCDILNLGS